jgi:tetrahydromethanopterin S-methyltransferase subunit B
MLFKLLTAARLLTIVCIAVTAHSVWAESRPSEFIAGEQVHVASAETRDQDLICVACKVTIDGTMDGDIVLIGGSLNVQGSVTGDAAVFGGSATLGDHAKMGGDVAVLAGTFTRAPGATIAGELDAPQVSGRRALAGLVLGLAAGFFVPLAIAGLLAVLIAFAVLHENRIRVLADTMRNRAGMAFLAGLATVAVYGFLLRALPLGHGIATIDLLLIAALCLALVAGYAGLSLAIGQRVAARSGPLAMTMIGAVIIAAVQIIPVVGWICFVFSGCLALGTAILTGFGAAPGWHESSRPASPAANGSVR